MFEVGMKMKIDWQIDLGRKLGQFVDGGISQDSIERYMKDIKHDASIPIDLDKIFHAIQHYSTDIDGLEDFEKENMRNRLRNIGKCLSEKDAAAFDDAIKLFFSDPYGDAKG